MKRFLRPLLFVLFVLLLVWLYRTVDFSAMLSVEGVRAFVERHAPYGPIVFIGVCIAGIFLHAPEIVLIAIGGVLFGRVQGFAYGWTGAVIGALSAFAITRYFARSTVQRLLAGRSERLRVLDEKLGRHGFLTVLVLRFVLFLAPPLNWTIGASRVSFRSYAAATALGIVPGTAITVFFADSVARMESSAELLRPGIVIPALLIVCFLVAAALAGRRLLRPAAPEAESAPPQPPA